MRTSRTRFQIAVVAFLLAPATAGVLAVHASAACERYVKTYVTRPIRNRVSKQTAAAWDAWRNAHPDWKPNPRRQRPKYVMTREETMKKVDFACEVEPDPTVLDMRLRPVDLEEGPPIAILPPMTSQLELPTPFTPVATELAELTPIVPLAIPVFAPVAGPVPEPQTWLLVGSGMAFLGLLAGMRALLPQVESAALSSGSR